MQRPTGIFVWLAGLLLTTSATTTGADDTVCDGVVYETVNPILKVHIIVTAFEPVQDTCWRISQGGELSDKYRIVIDFWRFDVEASPNCTKDFLLFTYGGFNSNDVILRACNDQPDDIATRKIKALAGEPVYVYYHKTAGSESTGWDLRYTVEEAPDNDNTALIVGATVGGIIGLILIIGIAYKVYKVLE